MTFTSRLTRTPRPFEQDPAAEIAAAFDDLSPDLRALLSGTAGCSPYLRGLMMRDDAWLRAALQADPEEAVDTALDDIDNDGDLGSALRRAKRRVALIVALADLGGVWSLGQVTDALTRLADRATDLAFTDAVAAQIARGKLPGIDDAHGAGGLVTLAMGKMGAFELNYSSDIDLIVLFDETRFSADDYPAAQTAFTKATRAACQILSEQTAEGYVFRTDLRLRPDPGVTPVAMAMARAERYYESVGRTWERAAHIKARPCGGDLAAGARYLDALSPFVWRKHLDFAAIQDAHDMRLRIRDHKGLGGPITLPGHDMKLGRGGIREIEFFTQTRQIIAGGRDPSLRVRGTLEGLDRLSAAGWIERGVADTLARHYTVFRDVEHRLQMIADAQTHALPDTGDGFERLACMMDTDAARLTRALDDALTEVAQLTEGFFASDRAPRAELPDMTDAQARLVDAWRRVPALRSERALDIFDRLKPRLLQRLLDGPRPDQALARFDDFLRGLPAGVQLFSLFEANPDLIDLIADIAGTTSDLAGYLARNAAVLDAVIGGAFFADWPGQDALGTALGQRLDRARDYETRLDAARAWTREWHFRIGVHHLRGLIDAATAGAQYADLAGAVLRRIWPVVVDEFAAKHGDPPGRGAMVLGMGSLGAGRLNARSDLDLIVIYDADGVDASEGRRPLPSPLYYIRLTQALVTALQAPMAEGRLYEVDMRLRPSGRQGPVATSLPSFAAYQRDEAWTWEHLALTRARPVAGSEALGHAVASVRDAVLAQIHDRAQVARDEVDMRARLFQAKPETDWDPKAGPGHLQDIELMATLLGLLASYPGQDAPGQIDAGQRAGLIEAREARDLAAAHAALADFNTAARLLEEGPIDPDALGGSGEALILRGTGQLAIADLRPYLKDHAARAADLIDRALARFIAEPEIAVSQPADPVDPKGLIREAFRIDGIGLSECRSIFVDWALSLPADMPPMRGIKALLSRHQGDPLDHPMQQVLRDGLDAPPEPKRRGGRAGRLSS
ncbi:glutamine-synthetase adenylyltransferase [Maribius pontilimi]|uniref:Glutamine-synthetase adenylyltransferase n=1 Tax=Palleronia pontilimi TaxID=1964209 RepID=A0A934IF66_9RHOB|nr:glutamine-synthetase adenylyltransferase [Palleronia pontilimi]MBJ3761758.1 glutamine-synthetase adenylyltransferase [Palleronia pontilimi]